MSWMHNIPQGASTSVHNSSQLFSFFPAVIFRAAWGATSGAEALRPVVKVFPLNVGKIETLIMSWESKCE